MDHMTEYRAPGPLTCDVTQGEKALAVRLGGELDVASAEWLEGVLVKLGADNEGPVALDLRMLEFIDSSGLRAIVAADAKIRDAGSRLVLVPGPDAVRRVFALTQLDQRLEFVSDPSSIGL